MSHHCLFWLSLIVTTLSVVHSEDIFINPWELPPVNAPFSSVNAAVGDTLTFIWPETQNHTVFINPSGTCDDFDAIFVGNASPVNYTFTDADVTQSPLFFADNLSGLCENGMNFAVSVTQLAGPTSAASEPPQAPVAPSSPVSAPISPTEAPTEVSTPPPTTPLPSAPPTTAVPATPSPTIPPPTLPPVEPTEAPIMIIPTEPPVIPTEVPTAAPVDTSEPSVEVEPTIKPTVAPTQPGSITETLTGLRMGLAGVTSLPTSSQAIWEESTKEFAESFIFSDMSDRVSNFVTTYTVTQVTPLTGRRNLLRGGMSQFSRELQQDAVIIDFDQIMRYDTTDSKVTALDMAQIPFNTTQSKQAYLTLLKSTGDTTLLQVGGVSNVVPAPGGPPSSAPAEGGDEDPILSTPAIIGIACGGGALLILIVLYFLYCRGGGKKNGKSVSKNDDEPPLHVNVRDDEVSTLAGPTGPPTYGDQR
jgi:hypothetical protein